MAVTSFQITQRSTVLDGRPFGEAGAYEKIAGVLRIGVDPAHPANEAIADLALAPRNAAGLVECESDFYVLRPRDASRGNRRLFLDVPNRGRKVALGMLNSTVRVPDPSAPEDFGNGFLMRHGQRGELPQGRAHRRRRRPAEVTPRRRRRAVYREPISP